MSLSPLYSRRVSMRRRHLVVAGHDQHREVRVALAPAPCRAPGSPRAATACGPWPRSTIRPSAGTGGGGDVDDHVAGLARRALEVADRLGAVALGDRDDVDRLGHLLLERAALGGAALALGLELLAALRAPCAGPAAASPCSPMRSAIVCWHGVRLLELAHRARLEVGQRVAPVRGRELAHAGPRATCSASRPPARARGSAPTPSCRRRTASPAPWPGGRSPRRRPRRPSRRGARRPCARGSVNCSSTWREARSNSAFTKSA